LKSSRFMVVNELSDGGLIEKIFFFRPFKLAQLIVSGDSSSFF
jgi:hypothetical protein